MSSTGIDTGTVAGAMTAALEAAIRAPSPHNTQPWLFEVGQGRIDVLLDRGRVLAVCDPDAREATLACGAALFNITVALAATGVACDVALNPDRDRQELLASVRVDGAHRPTANELRLAAAIGKRHTNRRPFLDRPLPVHVRHQLVEAARSAGARLSFVQDLGLFNALAAIVRRADHIQSEDPDFRAELARWTVGAGHEDGVPRSAGGPRAEGGGVLALRDYGNGTAVERPFESAPEVAVLTTSSDGRIDRLRAGRAMQAVLLTAAQGNVCASFLAQPIEVSSARVVLRALLGGREHPQTVLRLGYGFPGPITPRRAVTAVTRPLGMAARGGESD
jgi:hypothetical protein